MENNIKNQLKKSSLKHDENLDDVYSQNLSPNKTWQRMNYTKVPVETIDLDTPIRDDKVGSNQLNHQPQKPTI